MKHAGAAALDRLEPLLAEIRAAGTLVERTRGVFYRKGRAALHFHEHGEALYADLRCGAETEFVRFAATSEEDQVVLLAILKAGS